MDKSFLKNINVLYVEDEDDVRTLTSNILEKFVNNVVQAENGVIGVEQFRKHNVENLTEFTLDLIITDINMPKMNGLEMLQKINDFDSRIPSIITTAHHDADFLKQAINARVSGYVNKPLKIDMLIDSIALAAEPKYLRDKLEVMNKQLTTEVEKKTLELKTILDSQESMIFVVNENKLSSANKTFLEFFDLDNIEDYMNGSRCISSFFIKKENYFSTTNYENWLNEIIQLDDMNRIISMETKEKTQKIFRVDIKFLEKSGKHYVVSFTDITKLKEYTYELQYQATHDSLTKLCNRMKFNDELDKEILRENRYKHNLSMLMFDIDDFKKINDTYGHDIGDIVLIDIAKILTKSIRTTDFACRWGGEEFMVLLPETPLNDACNIAETIRQNIDDYQLESVESAITVSIGVSIFIVDTDSKETFVKNVDIALYEAKKTGKNKVVKYEK